MSRLSIRWRTAEFREWRHLHPNGHVLTDAEPGKDWHHRLALQPTTHFFVLLGSRGLECS